MKVKYNSTTMLLAGQEKNTHTIFIDDRGRNTPKPTKISTFFAVKIADETTAGLPRTFLF
ncbi:MAG: hypothetical protein DRP56_09690 [Planctomycetota bacterium]|nr:MAG: hypothetical protein DRP56_09690 [Planctomycetota bacterium]